MESRKPMELFHVLKANQQIFEVLEASKVLTDRVFDDLPIAMALLDAEQCVLKLNATALGLFSAKEKDSLGLPVDRIVPASTAAGIARYFGGRSTGEMATYGFEDQVQVGSGVRYFQWRIGQAFGLRQGHRQVHVLIGHDLTDARVALQSLVEVRRDLEVASTVQAMLVPDDAVRRGDFYALASHYEPAQQVGGDTWWHCELPGLGLFLVIADITGHGVAAGMVAANFVGTLASFVKLRPPRGTADLAAFFDEIGAVLTQSFKSDYIVCFAAALLYKDQPKMAVVGAGFPPLCKLAADGTHKTVSVPGDPLGMIGATPCAAVEEPFVPGDRLVCFSDGCYEDQVMSPMSRRYHFYKLLRRSAKEPLPAARRLIADELKRQRGDAPLADDVTFVLLERC